MALCAPGCGLVTDQLDVRRRVAHMAQGMARILVIVQAQIEDVEGALDACQYDTAAMQARAIVHECLAIRKVKLGGELTWPIDSVSYDGLSGHDPQRIEQARRIVNDALVLDANADRREWLDRLRAFVRSTEEDLEIAVELPTLRSPDGLYSAIRIARDAFDLVEELRLPPILPPGWHRAERDGGAS